MATLSSVSCWEDAILSQFGKRAKRHVVAVMCNMLTVDFGIKPAYLWDLLHPCVEKVLNVLLELRRKSSISNFLHVLTVRDEIFVFHLNHLVSHLKTLLREDQSSFLVDVSKALEMPLIAGVSIEAELKSWLRKLVTQLENFDCTQQQENGNTTTTVTPTRMPVLNFKVKNTWNLSTVFGALLGYPVLYCFNNNDGNDNCLALCPLRVYSVDFELLGKGQRNSSDEVCPIRGTVCSFSVPENLVPKVKNRVQDWFDSLTDKSKCDEAKYKLLTFQDTVTHAVVTL